MSLERFEHWLRVAAVLVVAFAFVHAVESFSFTPSPQFELRRTTDLSAPATESPMVEAITVAPQTAHCGPAIFDAWHSKSSPSGWFAHAPLTDTNVTVQASCRFESQHRVRTATLGLLIGMGVLLAVWFLARRRGFETGPAPDPAL